jgi:hypothetical protein
MPRPPSWIDKVNFITDFWSSPCSSTWYVYVETAWAAFGKVALVLVDIGLTDIIRSTMRPKGLRQARHGRKGRRGGRRIPSIPEPSDMVAKRIPGQRMLHNRWTDGGTKFLWRLDGVGQKAMNRYMIVNLVTDFLYDWGTGIIDDPLTDCEHRAEGQARKINEGVYLGVAGWSAIGIPVVEEERGGVNMLDFGAGLPSLGFQVIVAVKAERGFPPDGERKMGLRLVNEDGDVIQNSAFVDVPEVGTADCILTARCYGPGFVGYQIITLHGNLIVTEGLAWVRQMTGDPND